MTNQPHPWLNTIHTSPTNHTMNSFEYPFPIHSFDWGRLLLTSHHINHIIKSSSSKSNHHQTIHTPILFHIEPSNSFYTSSLPNGCWTQSHNHKSHHTTHVSLIQLSHITTALHFPPPNSPCESQLTCSSSVMCLIHSCQPEWLVLHCSCVVVRVWKSSSSHQHTIPFYLHHPHNQRQGCLQSCSQSIKQQC